MNFFPAGGFRTEAGLTVGLLTDEGYRNNWSRLIRRAGKPVKPAHWKFPDVRLYSARRKKERGNRPVSIEQTFGEGLVRLADHNSTAPPALLPSGGEWHKRGHVTVEEHDGTTVLTIPGPETGAVLPFPARDVEFYSVRFRYRSSRAFSMQIWDVDAQRNQLANISLYNDRIPEWLTDWAQFQT